MFNFTIENFVFGATMRAFFFFLSLFLLPLPFVVYQYLITHGPEWILAVSKTDLAGPVKVAVVLFTMIQWFATFILGCSLFAKRE